MVDKRSVSLIIISIAVYIGILLFLIYTHPKKSVLPEGHSWYGVTWTENEATPVLPISSSGDESLNDTLPIQNRMKRCIIKDGQFICYLDDNNSYMKTDGRKAILDGSEGDVCVEIPEFWFRFEEEKNDNGNRVIRLKISEEENDGYTYSPKMYVGAYEATINRNTGKLASVCTTVFDMQEEEITRQDNSSYIASSTGFSDGTQKTVSIAGFTENADTYRGCNNNKTYDSSTELTDANYWKNNLGRPVAGMSRDEYRAAEDKDTGKMMYLYDAHRALWILSFVEYRNKDIQSVLGLGATTWPSYDAFKEWTKNDTESIIPCGVTNSLGNKTGSVYICVKNAPIGLDENGSYIYGDVWVPCMSYRGIEHYWGHIYKTVDQINVWITDTKVKRIADNKRYYNVLYSYQKDPFKTDNSFKVSEYVDYVRFVPYICVTSGYLFGKDGHILPCDSFAEYSYYSPEGYADCVELTKRPGYSLMQMDVNGSLINNVLPGRNMVVAAYTPDGSLKRNSNGTRITYITGHNKYE